MFCTADTTMVVVSKKKRASFPRRGALLSGKGPQHIKNNVFSPQPLLYLIQMIPGTFQAHQPTLRRYKWDWFHWHVKYMGSHITSANAKIAGKYENFLPCCHPEPLGRPQERVAGGSRHLLEKEEQVEFLFLFHNL